MGSPWDPGSRPSQLTIPSGAHDAMAPWLESDGGTFEGFFRLDKEVFKVFTRPGKHSQFANWKKTLNICLMGKSL